MRRCISSFRLFFCFDREDTARGLTGEEKGEWVKDEATCTELRASASAFLCVKRRVCELLNARVLLTNARARIVTCVC